MNNVDAVKSLYKKHHLETGLTIRGDCEKDLSGVLLENGDSLAFTFDDVLTKKKELKDEYEKQAYARLRQQEYPDLQECIHAILDDDLTALQAKRKLIKEKYPKPE